MVNIFGTDGVRGVANSNFLTPDNIIKIAIATAATLRKQDPNHHHKVLIGKDTRLSGYLFENALTAGFTAAGVDVLLAGPVPTPAIAMLTKSMRADFGIMISASHNPYYDNGIKIFNDQGYKISIAQQQQVSEIVINENWSNFLSSPTKLGKAKRIDDVQGRYIEFVKSSFPKDINLEGLKIVMDCANGAAYQIGPTIISELGAMVIPMAINPNGFNINHECGSTNPQYMVNEVIANEADLGISLDGDADRVIICDEKGNLLDGDMIIAMIAGYWKKSGKLNGNKVVATNMTNLSCEQYLKNILSIDLVRTDVGDSNVMAAMLENKLNLGGEQSGHIIMSDFSSTGDGLIAALQVLALMVNAKKPLSKLSGLFEPYPQKITNLVFKNENPLDNQEILARLKNIYEQYNTKNTRIIVRKSGTEKLIRIMVEAPDIKLIDSATIEISNVITDSVKEFYNLKENS